MKIYGKKYKHRPLNPIAFANGVQSDDYRLYCLSSEFARYVRQFLARMVDNPYWFYSSMASSGYYVTPTKEVFDVVSATLSEGIGELMGGCNLEEKFDELILAIKQSCASDCGVTVGSQYAGQTEAAQNDYDDDEQGYPPGYTDRPAWLQQKCNMAHQIFNELDTDFGWLSVQNIVQVTALALATSLATPIFGDELVVILGTLVVIGGLWTGVIQDILQVIAATEDDFICALSSSGNAQEAYDAAYAVLEGDAAWANSVNQYLGMTLLNSWLNWNSLNRLFDGTVPDVTGSSCDGCEPLTCSWVASGTTQITSDNGSQVTFVTADQGGCHFSWVNAFYGGSTYCYKLVTAMSLTGFSEGQSCGGNPSDINAGENDGQGNITANHFSTKAAFDAWLGSGRNLSYLSIGYNNGQCTATMTYSAP